ncbi:hypothetical protein [Sedimentitalea todarodis]|uniref:Uncharacterized protein n=1 Tax=Sedimentitalea todarodis TaxID=1631240 RepID=A0ABU3V9Z0_9RHOB|nr:hypothetical protein [Sedimentitalea todarodis]MDU9002845.1 hypothetical protein [Sedimentitalea todarodis]
MLNIYAHSFMTAARTETTKLYDAPAKKPTKRRWLPAGHWWLRPSRCVDLDKL